ncbi:sensor histidine kinase [Halovenus marina]|uniref:sensor histidine kinase n=1 Tax=Halovenus marina TaxID=3396621 RepID=UPI003F550C46
MAGSSVGPGEWLCATLRGVQTAMVETDEPTAFSEALVERVVAVESHAFAWVGRVTAAGDLRTYAAATPGETVAVNPDLSSDGPSRRAAETGETQIHADISGNPEYDVFARYVDALPATNADTTLVAEVDAASDTNADAASVASLTIPVGERRVLTIYTTSTDVDPLVREMADELGAAVEWGYRSFETRRELARERERLESVRSVVSHDLGNPINVAAGRLSLAAEECDSEHLAHVERGLDQIEALADETLQFVEMSRRVQQREPISLAACARSCWAELDTGRGSLDISDATVEADPERLRRLVSELFENALVHSDGSVTVTVGTLSGHSGFFVADDGPGIPEGERAYVLDRGYSTLSDRDGNGLSVVSAIADAHDWTLELDHETDGTRVEVTTTRW